MITAVLAVIVSLHRPYPDTVSDSRAFSGC
jgi:hypothetical protein